MNITTPIRNAFTMVQFWAAMMRSYLGFKSLPPSRWLYRPKPKDSMLERLPVELLQHIVSYLNVPSAASFALCSRFVSLTLGTQHWSAVKEEREQRRVFLAMIQKDFPVYRLCHSCVKFHDRNLETIPLDPSFTRSPLNRCIQPEDFIYGPNNLCMSHQQVQLAMDRHFFGSAHGIPLDVFSQERHIPAAGIWSIFEWNSSEHDISLCARIIDDSLLIRWQLRICMSQVLPRLRWPQGQPTICMSRRQPRITDIRRSISALCPHRRNNIDDDIARSVICMISHIDGPEWCDLCTGINSCLYCFTDFKVELEGDAENTALIVTAWTDLGSGRNKDDPKWQSRLRIPPFRILPRKISFRPGSIQAAFNSGDATHKTTQSG